MAGAKFTQLADAATLFRHRPGRIPELEIEDKIGAGIDKGPMGLIRRLLPLRRAQPGILNSEGGGNDRDLAQGVVLPGLDNHPGNAGVEGKPGHQPSPPG